MVEDIHLDKKRTHSIMNNMHPPEKEMTPVKFTCLCFKGCFYTTDDSGFFVHYNKETKLSELFRCEYDPDDWEMKVNFIFIRNLNDTELMAFDNINEVNVLNNQTIHM